ncbi:MAG: DUF4157 domain-containing protein [Minicystis sp.]
MGSVDDPLEAEADRVADGVLQMPEPDATGATATAAGERRVQRRAELGASGGAPAAPPIVERTLSEGGGRPLGPGIRAYFEPRFGLDFSEVRVHTGARAEASARAVNAQAYTVGRDIVLGAGRYAPEGIEGRRLLAHELAHVAQAGGARPRAGTQEATTPLLGARAAPQVRRFSDPPSQDEIRSTLIQLDGLSIHDQLEAFEHDHASEIEVLRSNLAHFRGDIFEERLLATMSAVQLRGHITPQDFQKQFKSILDVVEAKGPGQVAEIAAYLKLGKNEKMVQPAGPGDAVIVGKKTYLVVEDRVRVKNDSNTSPAWRNNNPGNITVAKSNPAAWALDGCYKDKNTEGRFAIFKSYEAGFAGAKKWAEKQSKKTISRYFNDYSPDTESTNDPSGYAEKVAAAVGLTVDDTVQRVIDLGRLDTFVKKQQEVEGWVEGDTYSLFDAKLPPEVVAATRAYLDLSAAVATQKEIDEANKGP